MGQRTKVEGHRGVSGQRPGSEVKGHRARVKGHRVEVKGRRSQGSEVKGHGAEVKGHRRQRSKVMDQKVIVQGIEG